ncbi:phosphoglycerate mutase [Arthrobacter sp. Hiyo8]|nr:phosphoglycerate mutase [Arthrobacter sp. Hiyo8]
MIRHGQSAANADTSIYNRVPDYRIPLTELGVEQARAAGEALRRKLDGEPVCVYVSPYLRAYQTLEALNLGSLTERVIEEPGCVNRTGPTSRSPETSGTRRSSATSTGISSTGSARANQAPMCMTGFRPSWKPCTGIGRNPTTRPTPCW